MSSNRLEQLRESGSPLFNRRKLKLGTFSTNNSGGCAISTVDGVLSGRWKDSLDLALLADAMEFEALVPVGRWKGFGGITDFNGASLEVYTWAAAIAASTSKVGILATSHVSTVHPILAAKQGATIDNIADGRWALNVVTGYNQAEIEMFGTPMLPHDERYRMAEEWLGIVQRLWTSDQGFDHQGQFYTIKDGFLKPKPVTRPSPPVMCAGISETGRHFAAKYCDLSFIVAETHDYETLAARVASYKQLARDEYGREIAVWANSYIVQGDTEADALAYYRYYVEEKGDWEAANNVVNSLIANTKDMPAEKLRGKLRDMIAGWGGIALIGTKEQIVDKLAMLSRAGFDGILLSWPRYQEDMRRFQAETYPLLVEAGLR